MSLLTRAAVAVLLATATPAVASAATESGGKVAQEYDLKAVFLYNFARFVEWPPEAFSTPNAPITICVLGDDPFGPSLYQIVEDEVVGNHSVTARRCRDVSEADGCHILFIARSEADHLTRILSQVSGKSILTVGENDGFAKASGMIRFVLAGNRVRLRINVDAARAAKLTISSKLLRQAEIVQGETER